MSVFKLPGLVLAGAAAAFAASSPADGQCRLCTQPTTTASAEAAPSDDVRIEIETNLAFDRLILAGSGAGAATIRPNGSTGAEGSVSDVGPRAVVGTVLVHGGPGRAVSVELPRRIDLYSLSGGRMTLEDVTTDAPSAPRLDAAGNLSFRFGGRLIVTGDADGQYRGDLPITVEYADDLSNSAASLIRR
jgi:hypothetical protein